MTSSISCGITFGPLIDFIDFYTKLPLYECVKYKHEVKGSLTSLSKYKRWRDNLDVAANMDYGVVSF